MAKQSKYGFDYKGTIPLNFKLFPETDFIDKEGRMGVSNIKTRLEVDPETDKWYLFPTMMGGVDLPFEGTYRGAVEKGKHFGEYETYKEGMEADALIHQYFKKLKMGVSAEDKIIDSIKDL